MPHPSTVFRWAEENAPFRDQCARARDFQAETLVDEMQDIADDSTNDYMDRKLRDGSTIRVLDPEAIQRSKLRLEARRWNAEKLKPRKYGNRTTLDLNVEDKSLEELRAETKALLAKAGIDGSGITDQG